jgi:hypothetical protein
VVKKIDDLNIIMYDKMNKQKFIDAMTEVSSPTGIIDGIINAKEWVIINIVENMFNNCICGKVNNIYYVLWNKVNQKTVNVGYDCITKYLSELKEDAVVLCKQFTYKKTSKNPKRMCFGCQHHNIPADTESWRNICKTCWGSGSRAVTCPMLGNKVCLQCFTLTILPTSNNTICLACYKENNDFSKMDHNKLRACGTCGELKILKSDPEFKDKCSDCYKNAKNMEEMEEKRPCSLCNELLIPITKPDYVDKCTGCFKAATAAVEKRACSDCGFLKIPVTQPAFKNKCIDCFKLNITNNVQRECSVCLELLIPANKPSFVNKCDTCYKMSKESSLPNKTPNKTSSLGNIPTIPNKTSNKTSSLGNIPTIPNKTSNKGGIPTIPIKPKPDKEEDVDITAHMGNMNLIQSLMGKK